MFFLTRFSPGGPPGTLKKPEITVPKTTQDHPRPRKGNPVHAFDVEVLFGIITGVQYRVVSGFLFKILPKQKRVTGFLAEACEPALLVY